MIIAMKKTSITIITCVLLAVASREARAQNAGPRDLFNTYKSENATSTAKPTAGRPGARVRVELDRDGRARFVSTRTVFRAGDKVRFHFAMNFPGYVVVINQGSSGTRSLLFPYKGVSNHIGRTADYTVPQGEGWFEFDDTPGTEQLTFIMSKREIEEVTQVTTGSHGSSPSPAPSHPVSEHPVPAPPPATPAAAPTPTPAPATAATPAQTEEQEILAALNSRSLTRGRDLKMVEQETDAYVLTSDEALTKPLGFKLTLTHR
jgi:hypothetical protein